MKIATFAASAVGILLFLFGLAWLALLRAEPGPAVTRAVPDSQIAAGRADAMPAAGSPAIRSGVAGVSELGQVMRVQVLDTDLGSGSGEFSAVALNEGTNRLMVADDGDWLFEYALTADGSVRTPPLRSMRVNSGTGDLEGISWISGSTYAVAHENDGSITVLDLGEGDRVIEDRVIDDRHLIRTISTGIAEGPGGNGIEGVAAVPPKSPGEPATARRPANPDTMAFYVVSERPPVLHGIDVTGDIVVSTPVPGIADASDIAIADDGTISVLSDESRLLVDFTFDGEILREVGRMSLVFGDGRFEQPEGVVRSRDGTRLYVVGESPGDQRFSFGYWRRGP